jgi:hypothetical protein
MAGQVASGAKQPLHISISDDQLQRAVDHFLAHYLERNPLVDGKDGKDGAPGAQGKPGRDGSPGLNGKDGVNGKDGEPGRNGIDGRDGKDGIPGKDGQAGRDGRDGLDGKPGEAGKNGSDGANGKDGRDGKDGLNGEAGPRGEPGQGFRYVGSANISQSGIVWSGLRRVSVELKGVESAHAYIIVANAAVPEGYAIHDAIAVGDNLLSVAVTGPDLPEGETYTIPVRVYRIG